MHYLVVACSKDWRLHPTELGPAIRRVRDQLTAGPQRPFEKELKKYSSSDNLVAWEKIKAHLNREADHIFRTKPAVWFKRYGAHIGEPDYPELIFIDTKYGGKLGTNYGHRRSLALAGLHAYAQGNTKGMIRAIFLLLHHADSRRSGKLKGPRETRQGKPTKQEIAAFYRLPATMKIPQRRRASEAEKHFDRLGKSISAHSIRTTMKGGNGS